MTDSVLSLSYMVSKEGLSVDESKVATVKQWPLPTIVHEVRSFHGLVSFYWHFIHNFSIIMAPITDCMRAEKFLWTDEATTTFKLIKEKLTTSLVLALSDFSQPFKLQYDTSKVRVGVVLSQGGRPVAYFSKKLSGSKLNYNTYEFYAVVQALKHWSSYYAHNEFILYSDHEALKHLHSKDKLLSQHAVWAAYIQQFSFVIKHKPGVFNKVADELSRKASLLTTIRTKILGFDLFRESVSTNPYFSPIVSNLATG